MTSVISRDFFVMFSYTDFRSFLAIRSSLHFNHGCRPKNRAKINRLSLLGPNHSEQEGECFFDRPYRAFGNGYALST